jgi:hypothetical protein
MNAYTHGFQTRFTVHTRKLRPSEKLAALVNRSSAVDVKVGMEGGGPGVSNQFARPVGGAADEDAA